MAGIGVGLSCGVEPSPWGVKANSADLESEVS